ncbi:hypothetical protein HPB51_006865 [Rhipicephalus microplus]|uniref:Uncharacterized protein n=1 Tax=Rhipicephalus microplus TaxID=6941 RepID=A0A9J6E886_RHIMP|nr:hypothetical protein HPB51_006865 [Rhipicephalus microplus]
MMATKKLLVKDSSNTFNDKLVTFAADVPEDVLCACCWNISSQLMADPRDHLYCKSCLAMLDNDGKFDCVTDYAVHNIDEMKDRSERFREALKLIANCPNEGCNYRATLREIMNHMQDCDERPATCPHCAEEFDTFAEATANMMEKHAASCQHLSSLIDRVLHLEAELQDVKSALEEAKKDKEQLKQLIADKEDEYHKTDEYLRKNLQEDIDEVRTQVQEPTEIWGNNEPRNFIPNGYEGRDPECSNTGPSKLHEGVTDTKTDNSDTRCKDERQNCNFTGYVGRGQEFQKKEQSDLPPTAIESEEVLTFKLLQM